MIHSSFPLVQAINRTCHNQGRKGGALRVREHYLRSDDKLLFPFSATILGCQASHHSSGTETRRIYVLPDVKSLQFYIELMERLHEKAAIERSIGLTFLLMHTFLEIASDAMSQRERGVLWKFMQVVDPLIFYDDFCSETYVKDDPAASLSNACNWCLRQMKSSSPSIGYDSSIILISDEKLDIDSVSWTTMCWDSFINHFFSCQVSEELILIRSKLEECYIKKIQSPLECFSKLQASDPDFSGQSALDKSEILKEGILQISKYNPSEGFVVVSNKGSSDNILVSGRESLGQSFHGDKVSVRLLPNALWKVPESKKNLVVRNIAPDEDEDAEILSTNNFVDRVPTGKVINIIEQGRRKFVVTIPSEELSRGGETGVLAIPMDPRVPKIKLRTHQLSLLMEQRLLVQVDSWDENYRFPNGHYIRSLGRVGVAETEISALLVENDAVFPEFSASAMACLPDVNVSCSKCKSESLVCACNDVDNDWSIPNTVIDSRKDMRKDYRVFSVDPPGCQDIDDAMHVREMSLKDRSKLYINKDKIVRRLEIGVHIADVTFFVPHDSPLDKEARFRGTTTYLPHSRFDMLPALLSSNLCSLQGNRNRLAVSVFWEIEQINDGRGLDSELFRLAYNEDGTINAKFERTVIHSISAMTYDQAHILINAGEIKGEQVNVPPGQAGSPIPRENQTLIAEDLRKLTLFARWLRTERLKGGAIELSKKDYEFKFEKSTNMPLAVIEKEELEINRTIAELMILANRTVAEQIHKSFPTAALLRMHAPVSTEKLDDFHEIALKSGVSDGAKSNEMLKEALEKSQSMQEKEVSMLLKSLATRVMQEALYVCTGTFSENINMIKDVDRLSHYGLGIGRYTHFTSPIRRYADVIVHRLLLLSINDSFNIQYFEQLANKNDKPSKDSESLTVQRVLETPKTMPPKSQKLDKVSKTEPSVTQTGSATMQSFTNSRDNNLFSSVLHDSISSDKMNDESLIDSLLAAGIEESPSYCNAVNKESTNFGARRYESSRVNHTQTVASKNSFEIKNFGLSTNQHAQLTGNQSKTVESSSKTSGLKSLSNQRYGVSIPASQAPSVLLDEMDDDMLIDALLGTDTETATMSTIENNLCTRECKQNDGDHIEQAENRAIDSLKLEAPFDSKHLAELCIHLNDRNRTAKLLSFKAKELFLRLHFMNQVQIVDAVVLRLKTNGFIAYLPTYDIKGPVYLMDKNGIVQVDPNLVHLPSVNCGVPPSQGFGYMPTIRGIPEASLRLDETADELVLSVPHKKSIIFKVPMIVRLYVTCDVQLDKARLPDLRYGLAGIGNQASDLLEKSTLKQPIKRVEAGNEKLTSIDKMESYDGLDLPHLDTKGVQKELGEIQGELCGRGRISFGGFKTKVSAQKTVFEQYQYDYKVYDKDSENNKNKSSFDKKAWNDEHERAAQSEATRRIQREAAKKRQYKKTNN